MRLSSFSRLRQPWCLPRAEQLHHLLDADEVGAASEAVVTRRAATRGSPGRTRSRGRSIAEFVRHDRRGCASAACGPPSAGSSGLPRKAADARGRTRWKMTSRHQVTGLVLRCRASAALRLYDLATRAPSGAQDPLRLPAVELAHGNTALSTTAEMRSASRTLSSETPAPRRFSSRNPFGRSASALRPGIRREPRCSM